MTLLTLLLEYWSTWLTILAVVGAVWLVLVLCGLALLVVIVRVGLDCKDKLISIDESLNEIMKDTWEIREKSY